MMLLFSISPTNLGKVFMNIEIVALDITMISDLSNF